MGRAVVEGAVNQGHGAHVPVAHDVKVTRKPEVFLVSDSLATLNDVVNRTTGKQTISARNSTILVRKEGKWMVKAMMEGRRGDSMAAPPEAEAPAAAPAEGAAAAPPAK